MKSNQLQIISFNQYNYTIYMTLHKEICLLSNMYSYFCKINAILHIYPCLTNQWNEDFHSFYQKCKNKYKGSWRFIWWYMTEQWPQDKLPLLHMTSWRNGSASDSRSEGCVFASLWGQMDFFLIKVTIHNTCRERVSMCI